MIEHPEITARRHVVETGFPEVPGECVAYRSAVWEINGDTSTDCPLCGGPPDTHEPDPNEAAHPWPGASA